VSARRGPIGCEIAAEVVVGSLAHPGKLRTLSLSRCFVETAAAPADGQTVALRVPGREGRAEAHAQATVERGNHERVLDVGRMRGIELRLREIDAGFFSLYASQCKNVDRDKGAEKKAGAPSLESLLAGAAGAAGGRSERRDGPRVPSVVPLRVHGPAGEFLGATRDLSRTGCFVEAEDAPRIGEQLHLEFTLPDRKFHQEGVVVRVAGAAPTDAPHGFGVRFLPVTALLACARTQPGAAEPGPPLQLQLDDPAELAQVYLEQVKKGNLFVPTEQVLAENAVVWIELRRSGEDAHRARARVIRCSESPRGIGLQLLNPRTTAAWFEQSMRARRP
jgi:Tfp pilus assembly protein PilZ